ncbi:plasmid mobilization relaxosome protein MobC [Dechloromonas sp. ARDL1]|uniref:plasmid mobilization relaxosome protein MobC n=1 Tax=Dechloromonas sp. ARDL1 TaxID=3322121 RepID=UPI003DA74BA3
MTTQNEQQKAKPNRNKEYYEKTKGFVVSIRLPGSTMEKFDQMTEETQLGKSQLIKAILDGATIKVPNPRVTEELLRQLTAIGNNLNQLTKIANEAHKAGLINVGGLTSRLNDIYSQIDVIKGQL